MNRPALAPYLRFFFDDGSQSVVLASVLAVWAGSAILGGAGAKGHAANESVPVDQLVDAALIQLAVVDTVLGLG